MAPATAGRPADEGDLVAAIAPAEAPASVPETQNQPASRLPVRWSPGVRAHYPGQRIDDGPAMRVGFSPSGEALPDTLADVLARGSHAIRSAQKVEAERRERAAAIADHVDRQLADFLSICEVEDLIPPLSVRVYPSMARQHVHRRDRNRTIPTVRPPRQMPGSRPVGRRGGRAQVWPVLYWRSEGFPSAGRSLHLFLDAEGRTFEGLDDPGPLRVMGRQVRVWPVGVHDVVESMAEVDARRTAHQLVQGLAVLLWQAGVGL